MKTMTMRENAINSVKNITDETIQNWWERSHTPYYEWVECHPDGNIHETAEPDGNTRHTDLDGNPIERVYTIASGEYCDCDICTQYNRFNNIEDEEDIARFNEDFGQGSYDTWKNDWEGDFQTAITDYNHENGVYEEDVREEMVKAIQSLPYGYFDDETEDTNENKG